MQTRVLATLDAVAAADWNRLDRRGVPFLSHEFLAAIEHSASVGGDTGWHPTHIVAEQNGQLLGALPLYLKTHSWGEFVFDFSWAQAYSRHGLDYYPKLVAATPFTPAGGPRFLIAPDADLTNVRDALLQAAMTLAREQQASSLHVQFADAVDQEWLAERGLLRRLDCQFHWTNNGFSSFEQFLDTFTAEKRKKAKRERRRVLEAGISFQTLTGSEMDPGQWDQVYAFYANTFHRHRHEPYLNRAFFDEISRTLPGQPVVKLAVVAGTPIACAIFFRGADTLYGRYWGAAADFHSLHFEACYHQGIEYCIDNGIARFEPGTQGEHKIARGFAPTLTSSLHWIRDPRFSRAIGEFLTQERAAIEDYAQATAAHVPFRRVDFALPGEEPHADPGAAG